MHLGAFGWMLTSAGQAELARVADELAQGAAAMAVGQRLRRRLSPDQAAVLTSQATLRAAARDKFGDLADRLYFTAEGLEQATHPRVAAHRARRLSAVATGPLADLGCGIGADLIALAGHHPEVHGFDTDPLRVAVARANLAALGLPGIVSQADVTGLDLSPFAAAFADPARRNARGRVFEPSRYCPPWSFVEQLLRRRACVKVAPGVPHDRLPDGVEAEWVSWRGQVKEAALWSPALATASRRATVLTSRESATLTDHDVAGRAPVGAPGRFLVEPDAAVIRAGLVATVAAMVDGWLLDEHIAYLGCGTPVRTPYGRTFEVLEELPFAEKRLRAALRAREIGRLTIKKRGVEIVPERLRQRLRLTGDREATVVLTRCAGRGTALLVAPLDRTDQGAPH